MEEHERLQETQLQPRLNRVKSPKLWPEIFLYGRHCSIYTSGGNLFKNRPRASTSEYKQPPINLRLFQNTVKFLDNFFLSPKKQKSENETNFTQLPDSPVLNTINSYLYFNILITAPGYPSKTSA